MRVALYVEGGGNKSLNIKCREGFRKLLERAGFEGRMPAIVACGGRHNAFGDFQTAINSSKPNDYPILLVDSEGPVTQLSWAHLQALDGWVRPSAVNDDQAQLMVQCMETWILADRDALRKFFGHRLSESALPPLVDLESRAKDDIQSSLTFATRDCGREKCYQKGRRSFDLLARLDPRELRKRLPHFAELCKALDERL